MFEPFSHYLAYGATDQRTALELAGSYDGLLVPGTVAAFQREGTGGFILSLSATEAAPRYVIDPRFPLFQQDLRTPKKSHEALAELLGDPGLVTDIPPTPQDFPSDRIRRIAEHWVEFNTEYRDSTRRKFDKYAERLGEVVVEEAAQGPEAVIALYTVAMGVNDPWWGVSKELFVACSQATREDCIRVVAGAGPHSLTDLLDDVTDERLAVWVSGLEELNLLPGDLAAYGSAIGRAARSGRRVFALYGGFFHVLLGTIGLAGCSHGIGYGEYRNWLELPKSGPPPARYYLRQVHRYVSQELAYQLYLHDRSMAECDCEECDGQPPIALGYHDLMKHSVRARASEIAEWGSLEAAEAAEKLESEQRVFERKLDATSLPPFLRSQAERSCDHLPRWAAAIRLCADAT